MRRRWALSEDWNAFIEPEGGSMCKELDTTVWNTKDSIIYLGKKRFLFFFVFRYLTVFKGLLSMQHCWLCFEHLKSSAIYLTNDLEKEICKWKLCVKNKDKYMQTGLIVLIILLNQCRTIFKNNEFYLFKEPCFDTNVCTYSLSLSLSGTHTSIYKWHF